MKQFNLDKEKQKVAFTLSKRNLPQMRASVGLALDISGSTSGLYKRGVIQRLVEQIVPVGLRFDDNGNLDVYTFADGESISQVTGATEHNYPNFVKREILENTAVDKWGGTSYAPVIEKMLVDYGFRYEQKSGGFAGFGGSIKRLLKESSTSGEAVVNYFITDGVNDDKKATEALLQECQDAKANMYFCIIGVGDADFSFIEHLGEKFGNVGFLNVSDLEKFVDSDDIYEQLLPPEMTDWLKQKTA